MTTAIQTDFSKEESLTIDMGSEGNPKEPSEWAEEAEVSFDLTDGIQFGTDHSLTLEISQPIPTDEVTLPEITGTKIDETSKTIDLGDNTNIAIEKSTISQGDETIETSKSSDTIEVTSDNTKTSETIEETGEAKSNTQTLEENEPVAKSSESETIDETGEITESLTILQVTGITTEESTSKTTDIGVENKNSSETIEESASVSQNTEEQSQLSESRPEQSETIEKSETLLAKENSSTFTDIGIPQTFPSETETQESTTDDHPQTETSSHTMPGDGTPHTPTDSKTAEVSEKQTETTIDVIELSNGTSPHTDTIEVSAYEISSKNDSENTTSKWPFSNVTVVVYPVSELSSESKIESKYRNKENQDYSQNETTIRIIDKDSRSKAARIAKEEADRLAQEEKERKEQEEAERLAKIEEERLAKEEADRIAKEEQERKNPELLLQTTKNYTESQKTEFSLSDSISSLYIANKNPIYERQKNSFLQAEIKFQIYLYRLYQNNFFLKIGRAHV